MSRLTEILTQTLKNVRAFLFSWDALTFLFFVFLAACMWYAHALNSVRDLTIHVPVTYAGLPDDVEHNLPSHLDITLHDAGRRLLSQQHDMPNLVFDVQRQVNSGSGTIHISTEQIMQKLPTTLQGGGTAKIRSITPEEIVGSYSERFTEKVIKLPVETKDVPQGLTLRVFPAEVEVVVRVSQAHYQQVSANNIHVFCSFPKLGEDHLQLQATTQSKYVNNLRILPSEVEYIIEK